MEIKWIISQAVWLQALQPPQSFSVQKATENPESAQAIAAHNWTKVATQTWEHLTWDFDSHNASNASVAHHKDPQT